MRQELKVAVSFEVVDGKIQLFDKTGNKLSGRNTKWLGNFVCEKRGLTTLEGAPKEVGGGFYCDINNLTNLKGGPEVVGEGFYCSSNNLTNLEGAPKKVGGDFSCTRNILTSLKGAPKEVGGGFSCSINNLANLKGAPKEVGGSFYCNGNELTNLEGVPREHSHGSISRIFINKLRRGYVCADGILTKLISQRSCKDITVYKTKKLGTKEIVFVAQRGLSFSHGDSLKNAVSDLFYKISDRDTSEYENWNLHDEYTLVQLVVAYRKITGACFLGVKNFIENNKSIKDKMSIMEAIEVTSGKYGSDVFKEFFVKP